MSNPSPDIRHAIHWFELPVRSIDRTLPFYEQMLGLKLKRENFGGADMAIFPSDDGGIHGCLLAEPNTPLDNHGAALVYLNANPSLDEALRRVEAAGGRILKPRQELPEGMGCFAHVSDPEGRRVGLHAQS
jgi:predicted enzyme related to lactoylglutathione lyase